MVKNGNKKPKCDSDANTLDKKRYFSNIPTRTEFLQLMLKTRYSMQIPLKKMWT